MKILGLPPLDGTIFICYILAIVAVGFYCSSKVKNAKDFTSAGQSLTLPLVLGSTIATYFGAYIGSGAIEFINGNGVSAIICLMAFHVGLFIMGLLAKHMRASNATTYPEFIAYEFGEKSRTVASGISVLYLIGQTGGQFVAAGTVAHLLGLCSFRDGIIFGGIIIILLTITGGLVGVAVTDTIQQIFITVICVVLVPIFAFTNAGGVNFVFSNTDPVRLQAFGCMTPWAVVSTFMSFMLAFTADPAYAQRIFAAKDQRTAVLGVHLSNIISVIMCMPLYLSAFCLPFLFPDMTGGSQFVPAVVLNFMPPILKGLGIATFSSLLLTTGDTMLLTTSSVVTNDIYSKFRPNASDKTNLNVGRITTLVVGFLSIGLGLYFQSVFKVMSFFYGAYGAAIFIPVLLSAVCKNKIDNRVVPYSMTAAVAISVCVDAFSHTTNGVYFGCVVNLVGILVGSAVMRNKPLASE